MLTRRYDEALRPAGLTAAQFELMATLRIVGQADQRRLAELLAADQTTLSRNLKLLVTASLVASHQHTTDGRRQLYSVTKTGTAALEAATVAWSQVQADMEQSLGEPIAAVLPGLSNIQRAAGERQQGTEHALTA